LTIEFRVLLAFLVPLAISFSITSLMIRWAPALGLVDIPSDRKVHTRPTPKGGGLGIFAGWILTALWIGLDFKDLWVWGGIGLVIVVLGLVDDIRPLPWQLRLGIQMIAAIGALFVLGGIPRTDWLPFANYWLWPIAVIWIVGLTNAFNMLDNMDVLSAGVAWIAAFFFFIAGSILASTLSMHEPRFTSLSSLMIALLMLIGAIPGFLWFNRPPARIFMGDAGSTFLGLFFAVSSLRFIEISILGASPLILCILFIPWYDLVTVVTIRLWQGRSPFHADKQHLSHRLVALGLSPSRAVGVICLVATIIGAGGLLLFLLGTWDASIFIIPRRGPTSVWIFLISCWIALATFDYLTRKKRQTKIEPS
jgi:UDP-GlcNAc:undecaprenyl-phosphate GlcNAc-1-phosphate transferase